MAEFAEALRSAEIDRISTRTGARAVPTRELPRSPAAESRRRKRWLALAAVGLGLVAAAVGVFAWLRRSSESAAAVASGPDPRRIAVLYFQSRSGSDSLRYLADGLTEALINELSRVKGLQVISRNGVALYRDVPVSPDSLARALKVGTVVSGTLAQLGDRLRVNVALVNPSTGVELSSTTLEQPRAQVFALQEELAKEVSVFLRQALGQEVQLQELRVGTRNEKAWDLLQRATAEGKSADELIARGDSAAARRQFGRADSLFAAAEAADPRWVTPVAQRAWLAYRHARLNESDRTSSSEWIEKGLQHADRAIALKADDPDALEARGTLRYWRFLNNLEPDPAASSKLLADAEADFRAAVAANPTQASAWTSLSHLLLGWKREPAEGKLAAMRAYEADPYLTNANLTLWRLASSSVDLEDAVEAKRWCDEGRRRFQDDPRFAQCQLLVFSLKGQKPDVPTAWRMAEEYVRLSPPNLQEYRKHEGQMLVAMALVRAGLPDSARAVAVRARGDAALDPTRDLALWETYVRTMLGDRDEAFRLLSTYLAANPQDRPSNTEPGWWLRDLASDPRWKSIAGPSR
jgi:TolB-like protein